MPPERKARWRKEIDWLLSVTDYIVELVPSKQKGKDGSTMEVTTKHRNLIIIIIIVMMEKYVKCFCLSQIMVTRQRNDLHMNIPALRKLDGMLLVRLNALFCLFRMCYVSDKSDSYITF